jgi:ABC-type Fe3+-hydroxamate transport system substrate-binding protein
MGKNSFISVQNKELFWMLPFLCLCLMTMSLYRPTPSYQQLEGRVIIDAMGKKVVIPNNFKGVVATHFLNYYLEKTHAPEMLAKAGSKKGQHDFVFIPWRRDLMDWVFPRVARDESLWDFPTDLESILANDKDGYVYLSDFMYIGAIRYENLQERFGLNTVSIHPPSKYPLRETYEDLDKGTIIMANVLNDVIGQKEKANEFMAEYKNDLAELVNELELETLEHRPRVLGVGSSSTDWTYLWFGGNFDERLGLSNVTLEKNSLGRETDAERLLVIDPDIIFCSDMKDFMEDPRFLGLKAVKEKKVYPGTRFNPMPNDSNFYPLGLRHTAELVYPERLAPRLREKIKDKFRINYNYHLREYEIDYILNIEKMKGSEFLISRFGRNGPKESGESKLGQ